MADRYVKDRELVERMVAEQPSVAAAARLLGVSPSTLRRWLAVPARDCSDCGARLPDVHARRCRRCAGLRRRRWSPAQLLQAREAWKAEHDRPPSSYDWNPTLGPHYEPGRWPPAAAVIRRFDSWPAFLAAEAPEHPVR